MARYRFRENHEYAGRVHAVWRKPLENAGLSLIRLEFEIFTFGEGNRLSSTGKIACRDIVVGKGIDLQRDTTAMPYLNALEVRRPESAASWLELNDRDVWVKIVFGPIGAEDERNAFRSIFPLDVRGYQIIEYDYDLDAGWVEVSVAADDLGCSESTVRRRVARAEAEFGERLVRRTGGNHRRINLRLLRNLL